MKKIAQILICFFMAFLVFGLFVFPAQASPLFVPVNPQTTGLVSWWSMDEASGNRVDSYGANTLSVSGTVQSVVGKVGNAVSLNSSYLFINDNLSLSFGAGVSGSMCSWVKYNTLTNSYIFYKAWGATEYYLGYNSGTASIRFSVTNNGSTLTNVYASNATITAGAWNYICGGYDGAQIWVSVNDNARVVTSYSLGVLDGVETLRFGYGSNSVLDEAVFYKTSLTADNVLWLYNAGVGRSYSELLVSPTATNTPLPTSTNTPLPTATNTSAPLVTDTPLPATATNTPLPVATNTPDPFVTPTASVEQVFTTNVGQNHYFVLSLPLLFIDWQVAIIWIIAVANNNISLFLQSLPYKGYEIFLSFFIVGMMRRFLFRDK